MKTKNNVLIILFLLLFIPNLMYAQTSHDMEVLKEHVKEKVFQLNKRIARMANPQYEINERTDAKESAQRLFVNDCMPFLEIVDFKDGTQETIKRKGVEMQVSSHKRKKPNTRLMPIYFNGLINMTYKSVKMESSDIDNMEVSTLKPYGIDENGNKLYTCSVFYWQTFEGTTPEGRKYADITYKRIVCYVHVEEVLDERTGKMKPEYMVRLGDVHVISTEKLW